MEEYKQGESSKMAREADLETSARRTFRHVHTLINCSMPAATKRRKDVKKRVALETSQIQEDRLKPSVSVLPLL